MSMPFISIRHILSIWTLKRLQKLVNTSLQPFNEFDGVANGLHTMACKRQIYVSIVKNSTQSFIGANLT